MVKSAFQKYIFNVESGKYESQKIMTTVMAFHKLKETVAVHETVREAGVQSERMEG